MDSYSDASTRTGGPETMMGYAATSPYTDLARNIRLVHGLTWVQAADGSRQSIKDAAGDARLIARLVSPDDSVAVGQFLEQRGGAAKGKRLVSFAAFMAGVLREERQALVCLELGPGMSAMVGLVNGCPVPGSDNFGLRQEIGKLAEEFLAVYPDAVVYGNLHEIENRQLQPLDVAALAQDPEAAALLRASELRSVPSTRSLSWLLIVALLAIGGYMAYDYYEGKARAARLAAQKPVEKTPEERYAEGLDAAVRQEGLTIGAAEQMLKMLRGQSMQVPGWRVSRLQCVSSGCSALWIRTAKTASFADLVSALGKDKVTLQADQTGVQSLSVPAASETSKYPNTAALPGKNDAWVSLLSPLQKTAGRVTFTVGGGAAFPVSGITHAGSIRKHDLSVAGPVWLDSYLTTLPAWVMVRELAYEISNPSAVDGVKMSAKLVFFTKD